MMKRTAFIAGLAMLVSVVASNAQAATPMNDAQLGAIFAGASGAGNGNGNSNTGNNNGNGNGCGSNCGNVNGNGNTGSGNGNGTNANGTGNSPGWSGVIVVNGKVFFKP